MGVTVKQALKLIQARTEVTVYHKGFAYYDNSYARLLATLERENPHVLQAIVCEIQSVDYRNISILTYTGEEN